MVLNKSNTTKGSNKEKINEIKNILNIENDDDVINTSLTLLYWISNQLNQDNIILIASRDGKNVEQLYLPHFQQIPFQKGL